MSIACDWWGVSVTSSIVSACIGLVACSGGSDPAGATNPSFGPAGGPHLVSKPFDCTTLESTTLWTSSPSQVCKGVAATLAGADCHSLESTTLWTSSPSQVCQGVAAALAGADCHGLESTTLWTSSPSQVCQGVAAALAGADCHNLESTTLWTTSPSQVCQGFTPFRQGP